MTKREFLSELRMALEGNIPVQDIEDNIRYYDNYFAESGRPEREVCEELGDPRLIARTIRLLLQRDRWLTFIRSRQGMITAERAEMRAATRVMISVALETSGTTSCFVMCC